MANNLDDTQEEREFRDIRGIENVNSTVTMVHLSELLIILSTGTS